MNYQGPGVYQHYKGGQYAVFGLAKHTETEEVFVVYMSTKAEVDVMEIPDRVRMFARPLSMFNEQVGGVGGTPVDAVPRFRRIS